MSAAMIQAGIGGFMSLGQGWLQKQQIKAENKVNEANVYASNLMRGANNELSSKRASLARYGQTVGNQRILEDAGNEFNAGTTNYLRARDDMDNQDFDAQIAWAEAAGAQAAAGAASGLTGGAVDMIAGTMALREARQQQGVLKVRGQVAVDQSVLQRQRFLATVSQTDNRDIMTDIDQSIDLFAPKVKGTSTLGDWITGVAGSGAGGQAAQDTGTMVKSFFK
jgi:hypothetical protein